MNFHPGPEISDPKVPFLHKSEGLKNGEKLAFGFYISGVRKKLKKRLDGVNCIVISSQMLPHMNPQLLRCGLLGGGIIKSNNKSNNNVSN